MSHCLRRLGSAHPRNREQAHTSYRRAHTSYCRPLGPAYDLFGVTSDPIADQRILQDLEDGAAIGGKLEG